MPAKRYLPGKIVTDEIQLLICREYYKTITEYDHTKRAFRHADSERAEAFKKICDVFQITGQSLAFTQNYHLLWNMINASEKALTIKKKNLGIGTKVLARQNRSLSEIIGICWDYNLKIRFLDNPKRVNKTSDISPFEVEKVDDVAITVAIQGEFEQAIKATDGIVFSVSGITYARLQAGERFILLAQNDAQPESCELFLKTQQTLDDPNSGKAISMKTGRSITLTADSVVIKIDC